MRWLKRKLSNWLNESHRGELVASPPRDATLNANTAMTFGIYNASGGKIVEFRRYDNRTDRTTYSLHIVPDEEDFGELIAKISTMEMLRG